MGDETKTTKTNEPASAIPMNLYGILGCPRCKVGMEPIAEALLCPVCSVEYPIVDGVSILLPETDAGAINHERELGLREGYDAWFHRMIIQSLCDDQVILDAGSGNMVLDDPTLSGWM